MKNLGKFELQEQIGQGGFGTVYRAIDTTLGREVALKVLHPQLTTDSDFLQRFRNEAKMIASLDSANIVTIYELGEFEGRIFIAMRYLSGGSLKQRLEKEGALPLEDTIRIMKQICAGLSAAHKKGLVHRDIKPGNILFDGEGCAVLGDFGLARAIQVSSVSAASTTGAVGTPAYRAPELWLGKPPASPATDIYALGCVLSEMLTGKTLFDGDSTDVVITQHLVLGPTVSDEIPDNIKTLLTKALDKNPNRRYQTVDEFMQALESCGRVQQSVPAENKTPPISPAEEKPVRPPIPAPQKAPTKTPPLPPSPEPLLAVKKPGSRKKLSLLWFIIGGCGALALLALVIVLVSSNPQNYNDLATSTPIVTRIPVAVNPATEAPVHAPDFLACMVTDLAGVNDNEFNAAVWKGITNAETQYGIQGKNLESKQISDFASNIQSFIDEKCNLIIADGFLLADATRSAALANPDQKFAIVDVEMDPSVPNVISENFQVDQAAFLAGYLAAGISKTGVVGTYGGMEIKTVIIYMDGFARGVAYYNQVHHTTVKVIGWDVSSATGTFTGDFVAVDKSKNVARSMIAKGADVLMPVGDIISKGAAEVISQSSTADHPIYLIGVDFDWYNSYIYKSVILTSVMKNVDVATKSVIKSTIDGDSSNQYVGTLANGGVGLASFHDKENVVPSELKAELDLVKTGIISGTIVLNPDYKY